MTIAAVVITAIIAACGRSDDLWTRHLPLDGVAVTRSELTGYWEGEVSMGAIRVRIEPAAVTLSLRCDAAGEKVSQATAPIVVKRAPLPRMVLQADLAGGNKDCGFRFNKGDALGYALTGGSLEVAFAGASVARLAKLSDLPPPR